MFNRIGIKTAADSIFLVLYKGQPLHMDGGSVSLGSIGTGAKKGIKITRINLESPRYNWDPALDKGVLGTGPALDKGVLGTGP